MERGEVDGENEQTKGLFIILCEGHVNSTHNRLIDAYHFRPVPLLWPQTFGQVLIGQSPPSSLCALKSQADDTRLKSKRWIVDRATLKQARAEDMRYVKDPLFFDLFNIFTGNRGASPLRLLRNADTEIPQL